MQLNPSRLRSLSAATVLVLLSLCPIMAAEPVSIGLNFVSTDENSRLNVETTAGAFPHNNWNDVSQSGPNEEEGFINSRGEAIPLKLEWRSRRDSRGGKSTALQGEAVPDRKLLVATVSSPITITNIPQEFIQGGYSLYVYFRPEDEREWPLLISLKMPAQDDLKAEEIDRRWALTMKEEDLPQAGGETLVRTDGYFFGDGVPGGNYVVFAGLSEESFSIGTSRWINEGTVTGGSICAIQIVANQ